MSNKIDTNAYRILGLDVTATQKEILRRYKEITNRLKIDDHPEYDLDIGLKTDARTEDSVKEALSKLQSNKEHINEYFFWLRMHTLDDKKALTYILNEEYTKAIDAWKSASDGEGTNHYFSKKNLAILYCILLSKNDNLKYFKESLSIWNELMNSEKFWDAFSKDYSTPTGQKLERDNLLSFKEAVKGEVSDIYTDLGRIHKDPRYVKDSQEVFGARGKETEKSLLQPILNEISDMIDELRKIKISEDGKQVNNNKQTTAKIEEIDRIIGKIQKQLKELRENGLYEDPQARVIRDKVAEAIRLKSVDLHNYANLFEDSARLVRIAYKISGTESLKGSLEADEGKIKKSIEADKNTLLQIKVTSFLSTKYADFKLRSVTYDGTKISYDEVKGISFNGTRSNYSVTYNFSLECECGEQIMFSFSDAADWQKLVGIATQLIIPLIVTKYADKIFSGNGSVEIGGIRFDKKGYTKDKLWGGTDSVSWADKIYTPAFASGYVILYKEKDGKAVSFTNMLMGTPNAVVLPALVKECVNRAYALGLIPAKTQQAIQQQTVQFGQSNPNMPPKGYKTWQEYYDQIEREQRPALLKAFEESGGKSLSEAEKRALVNIRKTNVNGGSYDAENATITKLLEKGYIKEERGMFKNKYVIQRKGYNILNWLSSN